MDEAKKLNKEAKDLKSRAEEATDDLNDELNVVETLSADAQEVTIGNKDKRSVIRWT